ncbi:MAG: hypothetical protein Q7S61_00170 [bacterium]|nr:hypothetical protein [bacterium]
MKRYKIKRSQNIEANVGKVDGLAFQDNGTERIKGSFPYLVTDLKEMYNHLHDEALLLIDMYGSKKVSRLSSRYFVIESVVSELGKIHNVPLSHLLVNVEAKVPLGPLFIEEGILDPIWWVWLGGNSQKRIIGAEIKKILRDKMRGAMDSVKLPSSFTFPDGYKILAPTRKQMTQKYAEQLAQLYKERLPVYVADNSNSTYIQDVIMQSPDTFLFVALQESTDEIVAAVANEFSRYPVKLPTGEKREIVVCESNEWITRKDIPREVFYETLHRSLISAWDHNPQVIEAECVPESYWAAVQMGFQPTENPLERTSHMVTDGKNRELGDESIPEYYRKFNSLWLMYMILPKSL